MSIENKLGRNRINYSVFRRNIISGQYESKLKNAGKSSKPFLIKTLHIFVIFHS